MNRGFINNFLRRAEKTIKYELPYREEELSTRWAKLSSFPINLSGPLPLKVDIH